MKYPFPNYVGGAKHGDPICAVPTGERTIRFPVLDESPRTIEDRPLDRTVAYHEEAYEIRTMRFGEYDALDVWVQSDANDIEAEHQLWPMLLQKACSQKENFWPEDD